VNEVDLGIVDDAQRKAEEASRLLGNDAFNDAYRTLIENIERQLFMTDLGETEKREQLFHLHRGAQMFVNNIASRINHLQLNYEDE
jgi:hypothetical protein